MCKNQQPQVNLKFKTGSVNIIYAMVAGPATFMQSYYQNYAIFNFSINDIIRKPIMNEGPENVSTVWTSVGFRPNDKGLRDETL